jgi:hypothetical protein
VSAPGAALRIGVVGATEEQARERFEAEKNEWIKLAGLAGRQAR